MRIILKMCEIVNEWTREWMRVTLKVKVGVKVRIGSRGSEENDGSDKVKV